MQDFFFLTENIRALASRRNGPHQPDEHSALSSQRQHQKRKVRRKLRTQRHSQSHPL